MILFLLILGAVFGFITVYLDDHYYDILSGLSAFLGVILVSVGIILGCVRMTLPMRERSFAERYEYTKTMVEAADFKDYGQYNPIVKEVMDINSTIATHKRFDIPIVGNLFSEKIASYDYIIIKNEYGNTED